MAKRFYEFGCFFEVNAFDSIRNLQQADRQAVAALVRERAYAAIFAWGLGVNWSISRLSSTPNASLGLAWNPSIFQKNGSLMGPVRQWHICSENAITAKVIGESLMPYKPGKKRLNVSELPGGDGADTFGF